jgi:hypothetical protein
MRYVPDSTTTVGLGIRRHGGDAGHTEEHDAGIMRDAGKDCAVATGEGD